MFLWSDRRRILGKNSQEEFSGRCPFFSNGETEGQSMAEKLIERSIETSDPGQVFPDLLEQRYFPNSRPSQ